jgi:hypothetical protein
MSAPLINVAPYLSRASLAKALDMAESTVDEMVKRGVLPPPIKLSTGCVRSLHEPIADGAMTLADTISSNHEVWK